jgi:hypothetical protein
MPGGDGVGGGKLNSKGLYKLSISYIDYDRNGFFFFLHEIKELDV